MTSHGSEIISSKVVWFVFYQRPKSLYLSSRGTPDESPPQQTARVQLNKRREWLDQLRKRLGDALDKNKAFGICVQFAAHLHGRRPDQPLEEPKE
jgi:hypothetical protein